MSNISSIEMRNLIFEALSIENAEDTPRGNTFQMYEYRGCISDLFAIVEYLAIKHGLINQIVNIPKSAWGAPGYSLFYERNTSLTPENLDTFFEQFHYLINQNVLSPGAYGNYGDNLPYFHVTQYGLKCMGEKEILPHDPDGYIAKIKAAGANDWEEFYVDQALTCYNAGACNASIAMIGLAGECLAEQLIGALETFLNKNDAQAHQAYSSELFGKYKISEKYDTYEKYLKQLESQKDGNGNWLYPPLRSLKPAIDNHAKTVYATFLRLTRNEVAHPSDLKLEKDEALMIFVTYIKYCETQHKYLSFYQTNS